MRTLVVSITLVLSLPSALHAQWPPTFRFATIDSFPPPDPYSFGRPSAVSLQVDARGRPHIAYKARVGPVRYASRTEDAWQVEIANQRDERNCTLLLDSEGGPWILFQGGLLERTETGWTAHPHNDWPGDHVGGVMAADGTVHACFLRSYSWGRYYGTTEYATYQNGQWRYPWPTTLMENDGAFTHPDAVVSMCMASTGVPRLGVTDSGWAPAIYFWPQPSPPREPDLPHAILGSIAVDAQDRSHLVYYDTQTQDLEYAIFHDEAWDITPVDTEGDVGMYASLMLDPTGGAHIAYYDRTLGDLRYAKWSPAASQWSICVVDSEGDVGSWASLDLDPRGSVHIAYHDATANVLKYATTSPLVAVRPRSWSATKSAYR